MYAYQLSEESGPQGIIAVTLDDPVALPGSVVLDIDACGVCFPDVLMTQGKYQIRPPLPYIPGTEIAGTVREVAAGSAFSVGDKVMCMPGIGGFATQLAVPESLLTRVPEGLTQLEAAAYGINFPTAYFALKMRANLQPGEELVVLGSAGGIGVAMIRVGKALGAKVTAVVNREGHKDFLLAQGADHVVQLQGSAEGWGAEVMRVTGGGADVLVDPIGGEVFDEALRQVATDGRYVVVGFAAGGIPVVKLNRVLFRNISVIGAAWGEYISRKPESRSYIDAQLAALIAEGVRPPVSTIYQFADAPLAVQDLLDGKVIGKAVITMSSGTEVTAA